ncbi:MAG: proton-conducting transporter membrane subunit [Candidatus Zixiibacteriota bacterium]
METLLVAVSIILIGGVISLALHRSPGAATMAGVVGIVIGCLVGLVPSIHSLLSGGSDFIHRAWHVPGGSFFVGVDPLSAVFLLVIFVISVPVCSYGASYWWHHRNEYDLGAAWFFTSVLIGSMAMVVMARNAVLFLVAWEAMSVSSFFLVTLEHGKREVRRAGLIYLIAAHIGAAFLLVFFLLLGQHSGSLDFSRFSDAPQLTGVLFLLALIGFGSKAGFIPLHVWLPEAHPAAPSHISALMSGVMIKMGLYGLFRALTFLGPPAYWWGIVLIGVGLISGVVSVLHALAQSNIKRLLAYSSVENVGIIAIGTGIGILGWSTGSTAMAAFGFGGALLHIVNHAVFKGALFLAAGSVMQKCRTLDIDQLGGLLKRMPRTSTVALVASISIVGLPLGCGFVSEFLVYVAALHGASSARTDLAAASITVVIGLALIGGLAAVCFSKLFGIGFLGVPRSASATEANESDGLMTIPMLVLAGLCVVIGLGAFAVPVFAGGVVGLVTGIPSHAITDALQPSGNLLKALSVATTIIGLGVFVAAIARLFVLRNRSVRETVTWDCGYVAPSAEMQYRGFSFVQIVTGLFAGLLSIRKRQTLPSGLFPRRGLVSVKVPDGLLLSLYEPVFRGVGWTLGRLRWLQHGNVHLYILYILITLLILMFWNLR